MSRVLRCLLVAAAVLTAAGCGIDGSPKVDSLSPAASAALPCPGDQAQTARLGYTQYDRAPAAARFTTSGGPLYVTAHDFSRGAVLDFGPRGTAIHIGPAATPPSKDARTTVTPITAELSVDEDQYELLELPAGEYWLLTSNFAEITLVSCGPDAVTGTPAPRTTPFPGGSS